MSAIFYKLIEGNPVPCSWQEALAQLIEPDARILNSSLLRNGFWINTSFLVLDIDPLRLGVPRLWNTIVRSPDGSERVMGRYSTEAEAILGHALNVAFLDLCF